MKSMQPGPDVRLAALGCDVVPVGAALVALRAQASAPIVPLTHPTRP